MRITCTLLVLLTTAVISPLMGQTTKKADSLYAAGKELVRAAKYNEAEPLFKEAMQIYVSKNDSVSWFKSAMAYGSSIVDQGRYEEGLKIYLRLSEIQHLPIDKKRLGRLENYIGITYKKLGKLDKAEMHYLKSLDLFKSIQDSSYVATLTNNTAALYQSSGKYIKAVEMGKKALELYKEHRGTYEISIGYNNLGVTYEKLLMYDRAIEYHKKSLELKKELGNPDLLATTYNNLAVLEVKAGNIDMALNYYEKSLANRYKVNNPSKLAYTLTNIGSFYRKFGDSDKALDYFEEALTIQKKNGRIHKIAITLTNLGFSYLDRGKIDSARAMFSEALEYRNRYENQHLIAKSHLNLYETERRDNNLNKAHEHLQIALDIAGRSETRELKIDANVSASRFYRSIGELEKSLSYGREAYKLSGMVGQYQALYPMQQLAYTFHEIGSDSAITYGERVIEVIEEFRHNTGAAIDIKAGYLEDYIGFYNDLASWYIELDNYTRAFELIESSKGRALADELAKAESELDKKLPDEIRIQKRQKELDLNSLYSKLLEVTEPSMKDSLKRRIREQELGYSAYLNRLATDHPVYKNFEYPQPVSLSAARKIVDDKTAIISYSFTSEGLVAFVLTGNNVFARHLNIEKSTDLSFQTFLSNQIEQFRKDILTERPVRELVIQANQFSEYLLKPIIDELSGYQNLTISPDGPLVYLPFETLRHNDKYLVEQFNINYIPSVTVFELLPEPEKNHPRQLFALSGGNFDKMYSPYIVSRNNFDAIPATESEVDSIVNRFSDYTRYSTDDLSEEQLKSLPLNQYRFLHIATHGLIDESIPEQSGLLISSSRSEFKNGNDGILINSEIYNLELNAEMVVLSACNTALGKLIKGEGMLGIQRSFFYAGASTVISSLWNVYDRSTAFMMNEFYKLILSEDSAEKGWLDRFTGWFGYNSESITPGNKAKAMRSAKLKMINHPTYHHPIHWAPFIVVGR